MKNSADTLKTRGNQAASPVRNPSGKRPVRDKNLSSRRFLETEQLNRQAIRRNLYDDVGQSLAALKLSIHRIEKSLINEIKSAAAETQASADRIIEQLRLISDAILPTTLDDFGLPRTLENLCNEHCQSIGIKVYLDCEGLEQRLPLVTEAAVYRITRDTLVHIVAPAETEEIRISARVRNDTIILSITATGAGFEAPEDDDTHTSLKQMAALLGGNLKIKMQPERVRLTSRLPVTGMYDGGSANQGDWLLQKTEDKISSELNRPRQQ